MKTDILYQLRPSSIYLPIGDRSFYYAVPDGLFSTGPSNALLETRFIVQLYSSQLLVLFILRYCSL